MCSRLEALAEQGLDAAANGMAVGAGVDEHMRRERREAARHRPDVEIVRLDHLRHRDDRAADVGGVDLLRRHLQEDPGRVAQQAVARPEHERGHDEAGDRVGAIPARRQDDAARDRRPDECDEVRRDVQERAPHVEAVSTRARQEQRGAEIDRDADERDHKDDPAADVIRRDEPSHGLVEDPDPDQEEGQTVRLGGEDLKPPEAEGPASPGRSRRHRGGEEREAERGRIRDHVPRVREQRERACDDAGHELRGHEGDDQGQRAGERAPVVGRATVLVAVIVHLARG